MTVLTSLSEADLERAGIAGPPDDAVRRLALLAVGAGAQALVCSPREVAAVRAEVGPDITLITPGVRPPAPRVRTRRGWPPRAGVRRRRRPPGDRTPDHRRGRPGAAAAGIAAALRRSSGAAGRAV
nr:hypothetical protein GCM10020093_114220 [Planobispora longispora]